MKNKVLSMLGIIFEILALLGIGIQILLIIQSWGVIPDTVPVHFGISGKPDSYGEKKSLFFLPITAIIIFSALTFLGHYPKLISALLSLPEVDDAEKSKGLFQTTILFIRLIKLILVWLLTYINWRVIQIATGKAENLGFVFIGFIFSLILIIVVLRIFLLLLWHKSHSKLS